MLTGDTGRRLQLLPLSSAGQRVVWHIVYPRATVRGAAQGQLVHIVIGTGRAGGAGGADAARIRIIHRALLLALMRMMMAPMVVVVRFVLGQLIVIRCVAASPLMVVARLVAGSMASATR